VGLPRALRAIAQTTQLPVMKRLLIPAAIFLLLITASACAQPRVFLDDVSPTVKWNWKQQPVKLDNEIAGVAYFELTPHFLCERGGEIYYLGEVRAASRDNGGQGQCGCGIETTLIWFHLDHQLRTVSCKTVLIHSCWQNTSSNQPDRLGNMAQNDRVFEVDASRILGDTENEEVTRVRFDPQKPETGLEVKVFQRRWRE